MSDRRRDQIKEIKKDQQVVREVLDEIVTEIKQDHTEAHYRNPNRDQARGDCDRSGGHTDESLRSDSDSVDDGLGPKSTL